MALYTVIKHFPHYAYLAGRTFYRGCTDVDGLVLGAIMKGGKAAADTSLKIIDKTAGATKGICYTVIKNK